MSTDTLQNRRALISGASSGIGREAAHRLAAAGANVAIAARSVDALEELTDSIEAKEDVDLLVVPTDVTDEEQVTWMVDWTVEEFGGFDVVVNNASVDRSGPIEEMTTEEYSIVMTVNVDGMSS